MYVELSGLATPETSKMMGRPKATPKNTMRETTLAAKLTVLATLHTNPGTEYGRIP
jgi:hypothetical protein